MVIQTTDERGLRHDKSAGKKREIFGDMVIAHNEIRGFIGNGGTGNREFNFYGTDVGGWDCLS